MYVESVASQADLVRRLAERDATAVAEFYGRYRARVLATALQVVGNEWDAEEVLQDVCWTVFRKAHTFRAEGDFWPWVRRVTQNAARMLLRKRKRVPTPIEDSEVESFLNASTEICAPSRPEELAAQNVTLGRLTAALEGLDPTNQELFMSMEVDGVPKELVAEQLDLSVSAVKARLHRIRRALRGALESPQALAS